MQARVAAREVGMWRDRYVARVVELDATLDRAALEDFCVDTDVRSPSELARLVLTNAGWL